MKMKKILKEWRKFTITEGVTMQDQQLGSPDGWFSEWNNTLGSISSHPVWREKLKTEYGSFVQSLMDMINNPATMKGDKKEYGRLVSAINSGFAYHSSDSDMKGLTPPFDEVVKTKLSIYFDSPNISQEDKDFFAGNYDRIMDYGLETMAPNRQTRGPRASFNGNTAFYGSMDDWYMFGDGFLQTRRVMDDYFDKKDRPPASAPPEINEPSESEETNRKMQDKADFLNSFFDRFNK